MFWKDGCLSCLRFGFTFATSSRVPSPRLSLAPSICSVNPRRSFLLRAAGFLPVSGFELVSAPGDVVDLGGGDVPWGEDHGSPTRAEEPLISRGAECRVHGVSCMVEVPVGSWHSSRAWPTPFSSRLCSHSYPGAGLSIVNPCGQGMVAGRILSSGDRWDQRESWGPRGPGLSVWILF